MKKVLISVLFIAGIAAVAAGIFMMKRKPAPAVPEQRPAALKVREPSTPADGGAAPSSPGAPAVEMPPEQPPAPILVRFDAPVPPQMGKAAPVTIVVEANPKGWPVEIGTGARLDLLLRLPAGVKLASEEGWAPAQLPPEEKDDVTGPWSLYERQIPLPELKPGVPPEKLASQKVELIVAEEGINWIISARARLSQGSQTWQAFGVVFATLQGSEGQFHEVPKAPTDIRSAKAN